MNKARPVRKRSPFRYVVGLTGGIATGKTTIAVLFKKLGATVICCDMLAHEALVPGSKTYRAIIKAFGTTILSADKTIDRNALGSVIFERARERRKLEKIIHPYVLKRMKDAIAQASGIIIVDIPLLFETGFQKYVDMTIVVAASKKEQLERLMKRNKFSRKEASMRIASQMPLAQKKRLADKVINNNSLPRAIRAAQNIWCTLTMMCENEKK